ncbi:putative sporulation protein YtxC [Aquibacillus sp. 3ASR75-11]|uniref:Sporulation protein YtxC n=1 Tax=Terrihalobacillus insolitus TaxID=2950438 RepID=A0A9X4AL70_9BACI|nr:sporulation protein YtxC [Terrihalobacillus insolitus]MDC3412605.1 putative sporulation protein YtxC [Terrihalobacillus insolitus]MDC3423956.1 putative sporulation protein YtxC [Terrihalobacillus insolitus]
MLEVYFESKEETVTFCDRLFTYDNKLNIVWKTDVSIGNQVKIMEDKSKIGLPVAHALSDVFIQHREIHWIIDIIKTCYYYKHKEEINRIASLAQAIIAGEDADLADIVKDNRPRDMLLTLFWVNREESPIYFDSIMKFRFKNFREELIEVVGLAIDEFKREEDYQSFVQSLREYVAKKKSKYKAIHVLQGTNFSFYNENGKLLSHMELKALMQHEPLYIVGLDSNEMNITPLLAMAPKEINIYGDDPSEPKTTTIMNIFQEKVKRKHSHQFPF